MRVFSDFHHEGLYESLRILFEDRFKWELHRPIGRDWYDQGYWKLGNGGTVGQYLDIHIMDVYDMMYQGYAPILNANMTEISKGLFTINYPYYDIVKPHKGILLSAFKDMQYDILICSYPLHIEPFKELIKKYQPKAKLIFQIGNNGWDISKVSNILSSVTTIHNTLNKNYVFYHQEFDLNLFKYYQCENPEVVLNLMHGMDSNNVKMFLELEKILGWKNVMKGGMNRDGILTWPLSNTINQIKASGFIWHVKSEGDGYGYNLHNALACGKPIITKKSHFKGMTIEPKLIHGVTCIDLDIVDLHKAATMLKAMVKDYETISKKVIEVFNSHVNFDNEFLKIQNFMANLK